MSKEISVTLCCNELMHLVYDIFSKSAATTRHTEMCKMKVREMVELIEKDMANLNIERVVMPTMMVRLMKVKLPPMVMV